MFKKVIVLVMMLSFVFSGIAMASTHRFDGTGIGNVIINSNHVTVHDEVMHQGHLVQLVTVMILCEPTPELKEKLMGNNNGQDFDTIVINNVFCINKTTNKLFHTINRIAFIKNEKIFGEKELKNDFTEAKPSSFEFWLLKKSLEIK